MCTIATVINRNDVIVVELILMIDPKKFIFLLLPKPNLK